MITEDYVSFETAKLLKEKGFDEPCVWVYYPNSASFAKSRYKPKNSELNEYEYSKPTIQMAMKWLREKYNLNVCFRPVKFPSKIEWRAYIFNKDCEPLPINAICGKSYEEACESAIKYCIENFI